jgi:hypothetical protein
MWRERLTDRPPLVERQVVGGLCPCGTQLTSSELAVSVTSELLRQLIAEINTLGWVLHGREQAREILLPGLWVF